MTRLASATFVALLLAALSPGLALAQVDGVVESEPRQVDKEYAEFVAGRLKPFRWGMLKALRGTPVKAQTPKGVDQPACRGLSFMMTIGSTTVGLQRWRTKTTPDASLLFDSIFASVGYGLQDSTLVMERRGKDLLLLSITHETGVGPVGAGAIGRYLEAGWKGKPAPQDLALVICRYAPAGKTMGPRESFTHFSQSMKGRMGKGALAILWGARAKSSAPASQRAHASKFEDMSNPNEVRFNSGVGAQAVTGRVRLLSEGVLIGGGEAREKADATWSSVIELLKGRSVSTSLRAEEIRLPSLGRR